MRIRVSANGRHFARDGRPLFYLADTAWKLLHRLNRAECDVYLRDRAAKGFNVIQTALVAGTGGFTTVNAYGYPPVRNGDPAQIVEEYFDHVDWVVHRASELGLALALAPLWTGETEPAFCDGRSDEPKKRPLLTPRTAGAFGRDLARRFADAGVLWLVGSDNRSMDAAASVALARALHRRGKSANLVAALPATGVALPTLRADFVLSSVSDMVAGPGAVATDYRRRPVRPIVACGLGSEDWPAGADASDAAPSPDDAQVRRSAYLAVFNGAAGVAYGSEAVWQFPDPGRAAAGVVRRRWQQAIHLPGAVQLRHLRYLAEAYPQATRVPDASLVTRQRAGLAALRGVRRTYALVYCADGEPFSVDTRLLSVRDLAGRWFDPQKGTWVESGPVRRRAEVSFAPPERGRDWVLLLGAPAADRGGA